ncbi:MAG: acyl-CoA reductase [Thermofilaceae archaeon]
MSESVAPRYPGIGREDLELVSVADVSVLEPKADWLSSILRASVELQWELSNLPLNDRLKVIQFLGDSWREKLEANELQRVKEDLSKATGYSPSLIELEMQLVGEVLNAGNVRRLLDSTVIGGARSLEQPVEVAPGEYVRNLPAGPVLIVGSGNSIIPPLIPATISLAIGNFTILRPSLANFEAMGEVFRELDQLPADNPFRRALLVSYFTHESKNLAYLLEKAPLGVVNFWGREPARTRLARAVSANPHRPRFHVNGPMTGFAIIDSSNATPEVAERLALEMVLYDQQLCSSPTQAAFLGSFSELMEFASVLCDALDRVGREYPLSFESIPYPLFVMRKSLELAGARVYASSDPANPWTLVLSDRRTLMDRVPHDVLIPLHARRRFLELIAVETVSDAISLVKSLPANPAYAGVDRVQTLAVAVSEGVLRQIINALPLLGVYRVVPLGESYLRTPTEPYDGFYLPSVFSYTAYVRVRRS